MGKCLLMVSINKVKRIKMREPKYEPLKMGNKKHADNYGIKMQKYLKWKNEQERKLNDPRG